MDLGCMRGCKEMGEFGERRKYDCNILLRQN